MLLSARMIASVGELPQRRIHPLVSVTGIAYHSQQLRGRGFCFTGPARGVAAMKSFLLLRFPHISSFQ
ncbi:hypothetical protein, partial [Xanthomonas oryzae]|uniref:hypothetical protein n=1 Tax=Xanthomonas oryzae TaxID=347 RepID=UPI001ED92163